MKKIATKLITISSQLLLVSLFLVILFSSEVNNKKGSVVVENDNFVKMADSVSYLFEKEKDELIVDENIVTPLVSEEKLDTKKEDNVSDNTSKDNVVTDKGQDEVKTEPKKEENNVTPLEPEDAVISTVVGNLTGYGPDCYGCGGKTSTGFDLRETVYYEDSTYGIVRIVAADKSFPFYSIIRISNVPGMDPFLAIVLDRGGNVGYGKGTLFDLAFATEKDPNILGLTRNVTFELLRSGK